MDAELQGLKDSKTFTVMDKLPVGEKTVGSRWVFAYKQDKEGMIVKAKARLVAQGFMRREGVDFLSYVCTHSCCRIGEDCSCRCE